MKQRKLIIFTILIISLLVGILPADCYALKRKLNHNEKFKETNMLRGIDVSYHQGDIDWKQVKKAGVQFAFIRVAGRYALSGKLFEDMKAYENMQGAQDAGIPYGVYIYSQAITVKEAREEAAYILERIQGYDVTLPVVFDFEYLDVGEGRLWDAYLTKTEATNICMAFCNYVAEAGYEPMVYANKSMLADELHAGIISERYPIWLAHYTTATNYEGEYTFWQYSQSGKVAGIEEPVDLNVWYQSDEERVENLQISIENGGLQVSWTPVVGAIRYELWRRVDDNDFLLYQTICDLENPTCLDLEVKTDSLYTYKIRPVWENEEVGSYSQGVFGCVGITRAVKKVQGTSTLNEVSLQWEEISTAQLYVVERYHSSKGAYEQVGVVSKAAFTDGGLATSKKYKYRVRPCRQVGDAMVYGPYSKSVSVKTKSNAKGKVITEILNVRSKPNTESKILKSVKKNTILDLRGTVGDWYRIQIKLNGKKRQAYVSKEYVKILQVQAPIVSGKGTRFDRTKISWEQVERALGYEVQRYEPKQKRFVTVSKTEKTTYTDKELRAETTYQYRVRAYRVVKGVKIVSPYSGVLSVNTKTGIEGKIAGKKIALRKGAGTRYPKILTLSSGKKVYVFGRKGAWYHVRIKTKGRTYQGFVHKKYLKL